MLDQLKSDIAPMTAEWEGSSASAYQDAQRRWDGAAEELNTVLQSVSRAVTGWSVRGSQPAAADCPGHAPEGTGRQLHEDKESSVTTFHPKSGDITRKWYVIDATDVVLGRLATHVAGLLRGKGKAIYAPNTDCGDNVIIINADKVAISSNKRDREMRYRHSGY
ncbi:hypothetical protein KR044_001418, partial [Drosophila immigrans]